MLGFFPLLWAEQTVFLVPLCAIDGPVLTCPLAVKRNFKTPGLTFATVLLLSDKLLSYPKLSY